MSESSPAISSPAETILVVNRVIAKASECERKCIRAK